MVQKAKRDTIIPGISFIHNSAQWKISSEFSRINHLKNLYNF